MTRDERLMAYVDGELDDAARAEVEALLRDDADARRFVQAQRTLREQLAAAFDPVLDEPVPARLADAVRPPVRPPGLPEGVTAEVAGEVRRRPANAAWWTGLAASLALGVFIGQRLAGSQETASWVASSGGRLVAAASLAEALERRPGGRSAAADPVQVGWTYRSRAGRFCRTFRLPADGMAGAACRDEGRWQVQVMARQDGAAAGGDFRQAAAALPPAVLQAVDAQIEGEPLDATAEAQAPQRGWAR